jgi:hypothetical protein
VTPVRRQLEAAGANFVGLSLVETREQLQRVHALEPPTFAPAPAPAEGVEAQVSAPARA